MGSGRWRIDVLVPIDTLLPIDNRVPIDNLLPIDGLLPIGPRLAIDTLGGIDTKCSFYFYPLGFLPQVNAVARLHGGGGRVEYAIKRLIPGSDLHPAAAAWIEHFSA